MAKAATRAPWGMSEILRGSGQMVIERTDPWWQVGLWETEGEREGYREEEANDCGIRPATCDEGGGGLGSEVVDSHRLLRAALHGDGHWARAVDGASSVLVTGRILSLQDITCTTVAVSANWGVTLNQCNKVRVSKHA